MHYYYSYHDIDQTFIFGRFTITGQNYGSVDEIEIEDREAFFANVTSTNALNFTIHMHSDGITVKLEPVLPGTVRDGIIPGIDLSFQANNHTIGCHWNGFGNNQNDEIIGKHISSI